MLVHKVVVMESNDGAVGLFTHSDGNCHLKVPFGMVDMDPAEALAVLYKTFAVFRRTARSFERLGQQDGLEEHSEPGLEAQDGGTSFCDALGLDELFDRADPLHLLSLCERRAQQPWNVSRFLERHLHLAIFDKNAAPYLERVPGSRRETCYGATEIVGFYCFVAEDFYLAFLGADPTRVWGHFSADAQALAANFRHRYMAENDSLFSSDPQQCLRTRQHLQGLLSQINRSTSLRSADYRLLHDVLERYLYGGHAHQQRQGQIWGVKNFWAVWESVCLHHAATDQDGLGIKQFLTCDFDHLPAPLSTPERRAKWMTQREAMYHRNGIRRRPDLVLHTEAQVKVVDFKYYRDAPNQRYADVNEDDAVEIPLNKLDQDFNNMEIYGLLTHNHLLRTTGHSPNPITLEFWLPGSAVQSTPIRHEPAWVPPLEVVRLCTAEVVRNYSRQYDYRKP